MPVFQKSSHEAFAQAHARGMSASPAEENAVLIKKPEKTIKRDEMGWCDHYDLQSSTVRYRLKARHSAKQALGLVA
jgi:hypothetical protein